MALHATSEAHLKHRAMAVVNSNNRYAQTHAVEQGIMYAPHFWLGFSIMNGLSSVLRQRSENRFVQAVQHVSPELLINEMSLTALAGRVITEGYAALTCMSEEEKIDPIVSRFVTDENINAPDNAVYPFAQP